MFDILNSKMTQKCNRLSKYLAIFYFIGSYLLFSQVRTQQKAVAAPSVADCVDTAVIYAPCIFSVFHHGGSSVVQPGAAAGTRLIFKHADFSRSLCICIYKAHSLSQVSIMTAACMQGRGGGAVLRGQRWTSVSPPISLTGAAEDSRHAGGLTEVCLHPQSNRNNISSELDLLLTVLLRHHNTTCKGNTLYWIHQTT